MSNDAKRLEYAMLLGKDPNLTPEQRRAQFNQQMATPENDRAYGQWMQQHNLQEDPSYDLRSAFNAGLKPDERGHLPDTYKSPQHPTFSNESIHHGKNGQQGGEWVQVKKPSKTSPEGQWLFKASKFNMQNMNEQDMKSYFDRVEPGQTVQFPNGQKYTAPSQGQQNVRAIDQNLRQQMPPQEQQQFGGFEQMLYGQPGKAVQQKPPVKRPPAQKSDASNRTKELAAQREAIRNSIMQKMIQNYDVSTVRNNRGAGPLIRLDEFNERMGTQFPGVYHDPSGSSFSAHPLPLNNLTKEEQEYLGYKVQEGES